MPVELVFLHGWGFDARFWDALASRLPQFRQTRIDLGFFEDGAPALAQGLGATPMPSGPTVLIGHSLGFAYGVKQPASFSGWIAINGFLRFVKTPERPGCVSPAALRTMRLLLKNDPTTCFHDFYALMGVPPPGGTPNVERLREGLDELRDTDIEAIIAIRAIPGLVLTGGRDPLVPVETSEKLGHYAIDGAFETLETGGHVLPQSDPDWCAVRIAQFITRNFN